MQFRRVALSLATVLSLAIVACSSGTTQAASDSSGFVSELCELYARCCAKANLSTDGRVCRNVYSRIGAGKEYDPIEGTTCLSETRARANDPDFCAGSLERAASCNRVYRPKQSPDGSPIGASCTSDNDCAASPEGKVRCSPSSTGGMNPICELQIDGHAGDAPCLGTVDGSATIRTSTGIAGEVPPTSPSRGYLCNVADGVFCASTGSCTKVEGNGGPCDGSSWSCTNDSYCDPTTKTCAALLDEGSSCVSSDFACAKNLFCDLATRTCTRTKALGTPCTLSSACESAQCVNGACGSAPVSAALCGP